MGFAIFLAIVALLAIGTIKIAKLLSGKGKPSPQPRFPPIGSLDLTEKTDNPFDKLSRNNKVLISIQNGWPVSFKYSDNEGKETERTVIPIRLEGKMMTAWCYLRSDIRHFHMESAAFMKIHPQMILDSQAPT